MKEIFIHTTFGKQGPFTTQEVTNIKMLGRIDAETLVSIDDEEARVALKNLPLGALRVAEMQAAEPMPKKPQLITQAPEAPRIATFLFQEGESALRYDELRGKNIWALLSVPFFLLTLLIVLYRYTSDVGEDAKATVLVILWGTYLSTYFFGLLGGIKGLMIARSAKALGKRSSNGALISLIMILSVSFVFIGQSYGEFLEEVERVKQDHELYLKERKERMTPVKINDRYFRRW